MIHLGPRHEVRADEFVSGSGRIGRLLQRAEGLELAPRRPCQTVEGPAVSRFAEVDEGQLTIIESGHLDKAMIDTEVFSKHLYTRYYPCLLYTSDAADE